MRIRDVIIIIAIILGLLSLLYLLEVFLLLFAAIVFAVFIRGIVDFVSLKLHVRHYLASLLIVIILVVAGVGGAFLVLPSTVQQLQTLSVEFPRAVGELQESLDEQGWIQFLLGQIENIDYEQLRATLAQQAFGTFSSVFGTLATFLIIAILGLYLAIDPYTYRDGFVRLFPKNKRQRTERILSELKTKLHNWLIAKSISMSIIGVLTFIGLLLLGIPLAVALAVIAAFFTLIPNVGPVLSAIPAVILAFVQGPQQALYVIILYVGIQAVETYLVTPLVERKTLALPPALILVAQIIFGIFFGLLGIVLATPLLLTAIVLIRRLYIEDVLNDTKL